MIARLIALFSRPAPVVDMADVIIATRALRQHNRSEAGAASYRAVHANLKHKLGRPYLPPPDRRKHTT